MGARSKPSRRWRLSLFRDASLRERATSNLDAAEAQILKIASADYVLGQVPGVLRHVRDHLVPGNPQRLEFERLARQLGVTEADRPLPTSGPDRGTGKVGSPRARRTRAGSAAQAERPELAARRALVEEERALW